MAEALLDAGESLADGPVISVLGWNAASQLFAAWAAASPDANVFNIVEEISGYFIRLSEAATFNP